MTSRRNVVMRLAWLGLVGVAATLVTYVFIFAYPLGDAVRYGVILAVAFVGPAVWHLVRDGVPSDGDEAGNRCGTPEKQ